MYIPKNLTKFDKIYGRYNIYCFVAVAIALLGRMDPTANAVATRSKPIFQKQLGKAP
jgi:hypothetical protein